MNSTKARPALWAVALVWIGSILALATPLFGPAWSGAGSLFGVPRSLIWVLGWLTAMFLSLVWAYRTEPADDREAR